jgi:RNA polymerase sigma factor (sigma-70 family)
MGRNSSHDELASAATRNAELIRAAIKDHHDQMLRSVVVLVGTTEHHPDRRKVEDRAVEILDEAVLVALQRAADFDPTRSARAWIRGIAVRVLQNRRRREARDRRCLPATDRGENGWRALLERLMTGPADAAAAARLDLEQALRRISSTDCWIIKFRYHQGRSIEELAKKLGVRTLGAARVRLCRALRALRAQLPPS